MDVAEGGVEGVQPALLAAPPVGFVVVGVGVGRGAQADAGSLVGRQYGSQQRRQRALWKRPQTAVTRTSGRPASQAPSKRPRRQSLSSGHGRVVTIRSAACARASSRRIRCSSVGSTPRVWAASGLAGIIRTPDACAERHSRAASAKDWGPPSGSTKSADCTESSSTSRPAASRSRTLRARKQARRNRATTARRQSQRRREGGFFAAVPGEAGGGWAAI